MQAEFVNESYGEGANKLFFDGEALMQSGLAETVARAMPHLAPQIEAAAATGGMVEMTRGDFHAFLPQEAQHHLANIARMSPDAFSAAEAAAWEETEAAAEFEETAKRAHADAEAQLARQQEFDGLKARFKQELAATGRMNAQNADDAASVWASHIQSYAGRLNMTPDEFMGRYGRLNVVGESLMRDGAFSQALASAPPKGWVHVADGAEAAALWNGTSDAQAVFWDMPQGKLAAQLPEVAGYSFSVSRSAIGHIRKNHGNAEAEASRGLVAVDEADIARIPEMLADYDAVRTDLTATLGNKRIAFAKAFDNGTAVYLADVSRKKRDIQAVSLWKYPAGVDAQTALERAITEEKDKKRELPTSVDEPHSATANHTSETEAGISLFDGDDTTAAPLFQDMTAEQAQFAETEAAYGGREAYEAAKAEGRTELDYRQWVQVRTPAFKEWFGDWENDAANASKVVNPNTGEPLVVYHETDNQFTVFDTGRSGHQKNDFETPTGIFTKSSGEKIGLGNIQMPLFANIRNPLAFGDRVEILAFLQRNVPGFSQLHDEFADVDVSFADKLAEAESRDDALLDALLAGVEDTGLRGEILDDFDSRSEASKLLNEWDGHSDNLAQQMKRLFDDYVRQNGYDGMFVERDKGSFGRETDALIALMPNQIKSAVSNSGAFSADDDSILHQDARGMFDRMADTIALLKNADASTFIHEFGHFELETMSRIERDLRSVPPAEMTEGERQIVADFQTALDWFGVKDGDAWAAMTLDEQREHHEKFARGMEAYLFEGKAPSEALRGVFSRVARLLKRIYRTLAGLNVELSDDIRAVFGRLLASDEQIAEAEYVNGMKLLLDEDGELRAMDEAARREAQDELGKRALRDMAFARNARSREIRRLKREYKADFARAEMDARRSIMRQPVYRAWQLFTAKMTDEDRIDGNSKAEREFRRKAKVLQGKPVASINEKDLGMPADGGFEAVTSWAADLFAKAGGKAESPELGDVVLNRRSAKDSLAHGKFNPYKNMAFAAVKDVLEHGAVVARDTNEYGEESAYVSAPVSINGKENIVTVVVHKNNDVQRMYLHSVSTKENLLKPQVSGTLGNESRTHSGSLTSADVHNILHDALTYKPKADRTALDPSSDTLMTAVAKLGGLNKDELVREWGLDAKDKIPAPVFGMPVLRRSKGRSIDAMVEVLAEAGYLPVDSHGKADVRDLEERFSDGLSGRDWYSRHYVPREERKAGEEVVNPYALNAVRLDEASLADLPADWAQVLQERGMTAKTGGMHADLAAGLILDENGEPVFSDGLDLVQALVEALPPQEAIEDTARLNLLAEKGEVPMQADFEEAADLAVHNEMRARIIAAELKRLNDARREIREEAVADEKVRRKIVNEELGGLKNFVKGVKREAVADEKVRTKIVAQETNKLNAAVGTVSLLKQAAKVLAKEKIEKMLVRDLRASVFTRAEAAAAKAAEKAFKAGNIEEAAAHKRNQLIQNALAAETLRTREEMRDLRRKISKTQERIRLRRKRAGNPNKGVADLGYTEQISALLGYVGLAKAQAEREVPSIHTFVRAMEEAGIQHSIDPDYVDTISRKSWREMTVEEMRGLADTVRQLEHLGRLKNRLLSNQAKHSYQEVRDEMADTLDASAKAQHRKAQERREAATGLQKAGALLRGGYWAHLKMSTIVRMFDNGQDGGAFFTHFLLPLKQAADKEAAMQAEVSEKLYEVLKPLARHTGRLKTRLEGARAFQGLSDEEGKRKFTRENLFAIALNMGNAGNIQRLLDGEGWRMEDVQRALSSTLTAQEWHAVQGVWDLLESYRPQIAALERRMTGVEPEWVQARPFKIMSADGVEVELRGGYYPAKYDREGSGAAEKNEATTDAKAQTAAAGLAAATRRTFTKQRANEVKGRPLRLSLNVAYDAFNEIIHDLTHREAIADANRLLNSHTLDTKIRQYYGADAKRQLSRAIADIAQGNSGAAQALDGWAGRLRQNVSVAGLGFNIVSAALQLTGWIPAITRVGFANTAKALMTYAAHPRAATRGANEMSVMMANRSRTRFRELNDVANSVNGQNGVKAFVRRYAYWLMMRMQQVTDTIVWHGAMMKALDAGRSEADAVQLADQTVLDTQGGGQTKDLSAMERGGEVQKLFTVFYSYMNTALNMGAASIATQRGKGRLAAELMLVWVIPTALNAMMKSLLTPGDDDDDLAKKLAKEQISFMLGMFVGGRELAQLGDIATGGKFYGYTGPAGLRPIADTYKFAQQAQQGEFDKGLATATINILGSGFGLPSAQISRTLKGAQALDEGKTDNPAALLFGYDGKR